MTKLPQSDSKSLCHRSQSLNMEIILFRTADLSIPEEQMPLYSEIGCSSTFPVRSQWYRYINNCFYIATSCNWNQRRSIRCCQLLNIAYSQFPHFHLRQFLLDNILNGILTHLKNSHFLTVSSPRTYATCYLHRTIWNTTEKNLYVLWMRL